jgi:hypothetical protein
MRVAWPEILEWLNETDSDVYFKVEVPGVQGTPDDLLDDMWTAVERANAALESPDGEDIVWAQNVIPGVKGPKVHMRYFGTDEENKEWLDVFAGVLTERGWAGQVTVGKQEWFPQDFDREYFRRRPHLTCHLSLAIEDPSAFCAPGPGRWLGEQELARDICRFAVEWGAMPGAATYLGESTGQELIDDPRPAEALTKAATRSSQAHVTYLLSDPYRERCVGFTSSTATCGAATCSTPTARRC